MSQRMTFSGMPLRFREERTTQAAARLLKLHGGEMPYLKLIKLLYFADREALLQFGRPISYDLFVSMPHGPVLSRTLNLITDEPDPDRESYWRHYISEPHDYSVRLLGAAPNDQLSQAEEALLDSVFEKFGQLSKWQLRDLSHDLPEWRDPNGSSVPISIRDILLGQGVSEADAAAIEQELEALTIAEKLLG